MHSTGRLPRHQEEALIIHVMRTAAIAITGMYGMVKEPFSEYMKHYFRFCSEFGFQSLPSIKTVETFTGRKTAPFLQSYGEPSEKSGGKR